MTEDMFAYAISTQDVLDEIAAFWGEDEGTVLEDTDLRSDLGMEDFDLRELAEWLEDYFDLPDGSLQDIPSSAADLSQKVLAIFAQGDA